MADPFSIVAGIGLLAQGVGRIASANAEASQMEQEAARRELQAKEVDFKAIEDERVFRQQGREFMGDQVSAYAKAGVTMEGSPLMQLADTQYKIESQVAAQRRAAAFYSSQLRAGAASQLDAAGGTRTGGYVSGFGGLLTGFGQFASIKDANPKYTNASSPGVI